MQQPMAGCQAFGLGSFAGTRWADTRVKDLSDADVQKLRAAAETFTLEGDLRRQEGMAMKRLQDIGCLRGRRHRMGLPVRGQRTRTNARTRRGARKTVAGKKK